MALPQLSLDALPAWARLNDVTFKGVKFADVEGKGFGLVAGESVAAAQGGDSPPFITVPRDAVLSLEAVKRYALVDHRFKQLLDAAGDGTARQAILLYLLVHMVKLSLGPGSSSGVALSPWTEYIKFLPRPIPVPTMWRESERELLRGTSLEHALIAKLNALAREVDDLEEKSSDTPFWNTALWESGQSIGEYWVLADAWFRSRSLELPGHGVVMLPSIDMVNHSTRPSAYYEEIGNDVCLLPRPASNLASGHEVTISYGENKPPAEMLFSYGFIDDGMPVRELTLPLNAPTDDPLAKAKLHVFSGPRTVKLRRDSDGACSWESPFAYLLCLNEEDGLDFRLLQDVDGDTELRVFWQDEDVTDEAEQLGTMSESHPLSAVFELRVVSVLEDLVSSQLEALSNAAAQSEAQTLCTEDGDAPRQEHVEATKRLRAMEAEILRDSATELQQQQARLLEDQRVLAYLGSREDDQMEQRSSNNPADKAPADEAAASDEDDFS